MNKAMEIAIKAIEADNKNPNSVWAKHLELRALKAPVPVNMGVSLEMDQR
jgi:hypothetical protein